MELEKPSAGRKLESRAARRTAGEPEGKDVRDAEEVVSESRQWAAA